MLFAMLWRGGLPLRRLPRLTGFWLFRGFRRAGRITPPVFSSSSCLRSLASMELCVSPPCPATNRQWRHHKELKSRRHPNSSDVAATRRSWRCSPPRRPPDAVRGLFRSSIANRQSPPPILRRSRGLNNPRGMSRFQKRQTVGWIRGYPHAVVYEFYRRWCKRGLPSGFLGRMRDFSCRWVERRRCSI